MQLDLEDPEFRSIELVFFSDGEHFLLEVDRRFPESENQLFYSWLKAKALGSPDLISSREERVASRYFHRLLFNVGDSGADVEV